MKHFLSRHATFRHRLYSLYYTVFSYGRAFLILALCLWAGNFISRILPIMIPGSIIGLLILFFLLTFQILPTAWIRNGCHLFMRYMMILFIPAAMGIMDSYVLLLDNWLPILVSSIASLLLVLILTAYLAEYLNKHDKKEAAE